MQHSGSFRCDLSSGSKVGLGRVQCSRGFYPKKTRHYFVNHPTADFHEIWIHVIKYPIQTYRKGSSKIFPFTPKFAKTYRFWKIYVYRTVYGPRTLLWRVQSGPKTAQNA